MTEAQKKQSVDMVNALGTWLQTAKLTDRELAKKGVAVVVATARKLDLKALDDVRALEFDQAMGKFGIVFGGLKDIFNLSRIVLRNSVPSGNSFNKTVGKRLKLLHLRRRIPFLTILLVHFFSHFT